VDQGPFLEILQKLNREFRIDQSSRMTNDRGDGEGSPRSYIHQMGPSELPGRNDFDRECQNS